MKWILTFLTLAALAGIWLSGSVALIVLCAALALVLGLTLTDDD